MGWTKEQQLAIDLEGGNVIVSAGAGSGKTAVLTARVQRKLLTGVHVNELLVLTFTNAAAAEMKDRIRKTIRETPGLEKEASLVDSAFITTFDSFSLSIVKKYHTELNVTNQIQITDEVFINQKKHDILDEIMDKYYYSPSKDFLKLINDFCLKDDKELKEAILNIYQKIELKYDKSHYLEHYFDIEMNDEKITTTIHQYEELLKKKQGTLRELTSELGEYFDGDFISKIEDNFQEFLNATCYEEFVSGVSYKSITLPRGSDPVGKKIKQTIFDVASEMKDLCIYENTLEMREEILSTKSSVQVIVSILQELDERLDHYKRDESIYNFNDISRMAIQVVLEHEDIRKELQNQFQEILVDEYQDTSDTQEMFISLISRNNVYMVGDIKQSIYRFRNANPTIFKEKYDLYRDTDSGTKIDLLKNFRSRGEVLDDINLLFDCFMNDRFGGADYPASHRMNFGNTMYIQEGKTEQNYHFDVITYSKEELGRLSLDEEEAFIIGRDIKNKIDQSFMVFDKDQKVLRKIEYRDFVILLDKSKNFDLYKKIFEYYHIPLTILKEESLKKDDDVMVIKNLLRLLICMKEKRYDIEFRYVYTSVARSFLYQMSDKEIYEVFANDMFFESPLFLSCLPLLDDMDVLPLSAYLNYVLDQFHYEEKLMTIGNIRSFRTRREYLYQLCQNYEAMGKTIYDFVGYMNEIFEGDYDLKFNVLQETTNSCKIMTIHKSKGLEFPICYFAGFSSRFNLSELKERVLYDKDFGIILPKVEESYKDTIWKTLLKSRVREEEISEKIRLLYVALTRAKEKMIFVLPEMEEEEEMINQVPDYKKEKYLSFLSIMKSIYTVLLPYVKKSEVIGSKDYLKNSGDVSFDFQKREDSLMVEELSISEENIVEEKHYSKVSIHERDKEEKEKMEFGTKIHEILEELDFQNIDYSLFDMDDYMKKKIQSFLSSKLMKDRLTLPMYKEYEFIDEEDGEISHGIIDLMIEEENQIIIIDYKLKNILDEAYQEQLNGYRDYIQKKTGKKVSCYLYSLLDETYQEVTSC